MTGMGAKRTTLQWSYVGRNRNGSFGVSSGDKQTLGSIYTPTAANMMRAVLRLRQGCAANRTPPGPISPGNGALNL
jgi:hypothetical protein